MKYAFVVEAKISMSVEVEADSLDEAIDKAKELDPQKLCWSCSRGTDGAWNTSGELDCSPSESQLVDLHTDDKTATYDLALDKWEQR